MVTKAYQKNNSGAGIAWRENGKVKWMKGLELNEVQKLIATVPLPYIVHFRIPTCGGNVPALCHPFPVTQDTNEDLAGELDGWVVFHNGHWSSWKDKLFSVSASSGIMLPRGKWSDSRAMAWVASICGISSLELTEEKVVAFSPTDIEIFGTGWSKEGTVWVSNRLFLTTATVVYSSGKIYNYNSKETAKKEEVKTPVSDNKDKKVEAGALKDLPFAEVTVLYNQGRCSKNQYKKAQRKFERLLAKQRKTNLVTSN